MARGLQVHREVALAGKGFVLFVWVSSKNSGDVLHIFPGTLSQKCLTLPQYSLPCLEIFMGFLFFALEGVCFLEEAHYKVIKTENQDIFIRSSV